jgi:hypothetical protein
MTFDWRTNGPKEMVSENLGAHDFMRLSDWAEVAHVQQLTVGPNMPHPACCGLAMVRFLSSCTDELHSSPCNSSFFIDASVQVGTTQMHSSQCNSLFFTDELRSSPCNSSFFTDASVQAGTSQPRLFHPCVPAHHLLPARQTHKRMDVPLDKSQDCIFISSEKCYEFRNTLKPDIVTGGSVLLTDSGAKHDC